MFQLSRNKRRNKPISAISALLFAIFIATPIVGVVTSSTVHALGGTPGDQPPPEDGYLPTDNVLALKLLVITATENDNELQAIERYLKLLGTPYDVLVAKDQELTNNLLIDETTGAGNYQGIIITNSGLGFSDDQGNWGSAFDDEEWQRLWDYEKTYQVRQVALFTFPSTDPEDYGISYVDSVSVFTQDFPVSLTADGQSMFGYLNPTANIPLRFSFVYQASITPGSTATPLMIGPEGNVLAVQSNTADGRERVALTYSHDAFQTHSQLVMYGLIQWVTKGTFIGSRQHYLQVDVDDWFQFSDRWNPETMQSDEDVYRLSYKDALKVKQHQRNFIKRNRNHIKRFEIAIAFNGHLADTKAKRTCKPKGNKNDPLTSVSKCMRKNFDWVNHTYTEISMDFADYPTASYEISQNITTGKKLGLDMSKTGLITGSHSGLGFYADENGVLVDHGLEGSNPNLLAAARDNGVKFLAANHSVPSQQVPDCPVCGIYHPIEPEVFLVPRYPTNVFYNVTTPAEMVSEYNSIYGPNGRTPFWDHDLNYEEILEVETDQALLHMAAFQPYPHFFHQANFHEYTKGSNLVFDWMNRLMEKYKAIYNLPVVNLEWDKLGPQVKKLTDFRSAKASGYIDLGSKTIHLSSENGGPVLFTTPTKPSGLGVTQKKYGAEYLGEISTSASGETVVNY